jgi:hypothetical protein
MQHGGGLRIVVTVAAAVVLLCNAAVRWLDRRGGAA